VRCPWDCGRLWQIEILRCAQNDREALERGTALSCPVESTIPSPLAGEGSGEGNELSLLI